MTGRGPVLTALAIIPDRELAGPVLASALERTRSFQILSEFKSYPRSRRWKSGCVRPSRTSSCSTWRRTSIRPAS
jgi:hypothetical protein